MARWSLPVDTNEDPRHSESKQYTDTGAPTPTVSKMQ